MVQEAWPLTSCFFVICALYHFNCKKDTVSCDICSSSWFQKDLGDSPCLCAPFLLPTVRFLASKHRKCDHACAMSRSPTALKIQKDFDMTSCAANVPKGNISSITSSGESFSWKPLCLILMSRYCPARKYIKSLLLLLSCHSPSRLPNTSFPKVPSSGTMSLPSRLPDYERLA